MNWTTVLWPMLASACLTLALIHLFIWRKQTRQWAHLAFSLAASAAAACTLVEFMAMHATTAAQISTVLRWAHLPALVLYAAIAYFVRFYFNAGRSWLAWAVCGLRALALILSFTTGQNLFFKEVTGLKQVEIFGGETISIAQGILNPWYVIGPLSSLALVAFVLDASFALWRRGTKTDRRRAAVFGGSLSFFLITAVAHSILVNIGLINSPYIVGFSFMPTIIAMSYELSSDVLRAASLAQQLQVSEAALRITKQRMSLAASAAELGLWEWDIARNEVWCMDQGRALFGISNSEKLNFERFLAALYPEDREPVAQALQKALAGGSDYESEYRVLLPDERMRWLATSGRIEYINGVPMLMHGVTFDITRRKQAELEVERHRNELAHLSRVTLLGELSGSLAHELNQPLAAILSNAQAAQRFLAQDDVYLGEVRDILGDIIDEDKRAGEVIHRLRLLLKKGEVRQQPLNLNAVVQDVLQLARGDLLNNHVTVSIDLASDLSLVLGDHVQLQQVLLNLLVNGCEAMTNTDIADRRLHIRSASSGAEMLVSVGDRGCGIAGGDMEKIFTPFTTTKAQGMGLGLAICGSIVAAHGGRLWAENGGEHGAVFHFTLPAMSTTNA